jgi:hypothetical protein
MTCEIIEVISLPVVLEKVGGIEGFTTIDVTVTVTKPEAVRIVVECETRTS